MKIIITAVIIWAISLAIVLSFFYGVSLFNKEGKQNVNKEGKQNVNK